MAPRSIGAPVAPDAFWHKPTIARPDGGTIDNVVPFTTVDVEMPGEEDISPPEDGVLHIPTEDGGVIVDFSGRPQDTGDEDDEDVDVNFDENLAERMDVFDLTRIAEELLEGIDVDLRDREEWLATRDRAIDLLGLKLDPPRTGPGGGSAPLEGMSTAKDPTLTEAVVRCQAKAIGEFLPAEGPAKIEDVGDTGDDELTELFEKDFNYFLTDTATEYVPDTKRMYAWLYFGGSSVKKVYSCPLRRRPVSESVDMQNFLVSNAATDLANADRVTHISLMRKSRFRRMVAAGVYVDIDVAPPTAPDKDRVTQKLESVEGVRSDNTRDQDQPHTIYEVLCELEIDLDRKVPSALKNARVPVPYRVTIEKDSRRILEIRRNWEPDDEQCLPDEMYVKYSFIDWIGFYGIGLLHLIGNLTLALTAMLRIGIDAGMFHNFQGGLTAKSATRQLQNDFVVGPGQFPSVDTSMIPDGDIRKAVMPLPTKDLSAGFIQMRDKVSELARQVGGTADMPVTEGRADIPVGTILALIEQATQVESAAHKGMHQSTSKEFKLLLKLFRRDPEAFWRYQRKAKKRGGTSSWDEARLLQAIENYDLVPRSDPNTPSHIHRIMRAVALIQMAEGAAAKGFTRFDLEKIYKEALKVLRYANPDQYFLPAPPPTAPDPKLIEAQAKLKTADAKTLDTQTKAQTAEQSVKEKLLGHVSDEKIATLKLAQEEVIHRADQARYGHESGLDRAKLALQAHDQAHSHALDRAGLALDATKASHDAAIAAAEVNQKANEPTEGAS